MTKSIRNLCFALALIASSFSLQAFAKSKDINATVVLVHGAFADGSGWEKVIPLLKARGLNVVAVQNPLTSLGDDVATTQRALNRINQNVILVGHSWGGAVITQAGMDDKVKALVYVAAFAPSEGESASSSSKDYPASPGIQTLRIDAEGFATLPAESVAHNFAQDLPPMQTTIMSATQGPIKAAAFDEVLTTAAWRNKTSYYIVAKHDRMIQPEYQEAMATKMNASTTSIYSSHVPMLSRPVHVARIIIKAAENL